MTIEVGSADAPLENASTKLLTVYRKGKSMIHLLCSLGELTRNLREPDVQRRLELAKIRANATIDCFENDMLKGYIIPKLTVAMNPVIIESLLLGTIAYNAQRLPRNTWPSCIGPGIYAVGLAVEGRKGKFLRGCELLLVADAIAKYADGWDSLQAPDPKTLQQQDKIKLAQSMEDRIMQTTRISIAANLRFITNSADAARVRLLAERLQFRANASLAVDPTSTTIMVQSPLYIGCSTDLKDRTANYKLSNVTRINKLLGLTVTAMEYCRYDPVLAVKPVLRVWDNNHLPVAERMVSAFASSLAALDGFNATEAGGKPSNVGASMLSAIKQSVFYYERFHANNVREAKKAFQDRIDYLEKVSKLDQDQRRLIDRAVALKEEFESAIRGHRLRTSSERIAEVAELQRRLDAIEARVDAFQKKVDLAQGHLRNVRPIIDFLIKKGLLSDAADVVVPRSPETTSDDLQSASANDSMIIQCTDDTIICRTDSPS
ncbi:hypothetical protein CRV24_006858 [Beauveria bassiana]|nr:hypothetical protein CRV24_006858 [Beauveria bassiana]KAH8712984.1 hypothetical protein HC256_006159 [Beauveria bassiana]